MSRASDAADASSQSSSLTTNWFASVFGQCYKGPPVEGELRFEANKDSRSAAAAPGAAGSRGSTTTAEPKATPRVKKGQTGRYKIDNSILKIANRPGVAFRLSKNESDKVRGEVSPAKWDDIVEGVEEGDGWLRVGHFFLPMTFEGVPVVTRVQDSDAEVQKAKQGSQSQGDLPPTAESDSGASSGLRVESPPATRKSAACGESPSTAPPPRSSAPPAPASQATPASQVCIGAKGEPKSCEAAGVAFEGTKPCTPVAVATAHMSAAPKQELKAADGGGKQEQREVKELKHEPLGSSDAREMAASAPAKAEVCLAAAIPAVDNSWVVTEWDNISTSLKSVEDGMEKKQAHQPPWLPQEQQCVWYAQPSVGTWLLARPPAALPTAAVVTWKERTIAEKTPAPAKVKFVLLPSVGTWYRTLPPHGARM